MGNFSGSLGGHFTLRASVYEVSVDTANNRSLVRMDLWLDCDETNSGVWESSPPVTWNASVNGNNPSGSTSVDFRGNNNSVLFTTFDTWCAHDSSGNGSYGWSASCNMNDGPYVTTAFISGSIGLTHINRYANIDGGPNFDVVTDEYIRVAWHSDSPVDYTTWWSSVYDGGGHHDTATGGQGWFYLDLHGLRSNTQYDFTVGVRRADSGLWTFSGTAYATTAKQTNFMRRGAFR